MATCAPHTAVDTLTSSATGLHPAGPLALSMRSHLHAYDARSSWEGVSGTLAQLVAVRQGSVTVVKPVSGYMGCRPVWVAACGRVASRTE